jgi:fructose/tagatose bisphosphate aldolase
VRKINFSTALRVQYLSAFQEYLANHPEELMVGKILQGIESKVKEAIRECIIASCAEGKV